MPLVASVDYPSRRIFLSADSMGVSVHPVEVYKEVRALRRLTPLHRRFLPLISARGNESAGPTNTPILTIMANAARIVPFDNSHTLEIGGNVVSVAEDLAGPDLFDRLPLSPTTDVDISYQPPQVEVIEVEKPTAATDIAAAVWSRIMESDLSAEDMMRILISATAGQGGPDGSGNYRYRDVANSKDRIIAAVNGQGNRTGVTLDAD